METYDTIISMDSEPQRLLLFHCHGYCKQICRGDLMGEKKLGPILMNLSVSGNSIAHRQDNVLLQTFFQVPQLFSLHFEALAAVF